MFSMREYFSNFDPYDYPYFNSAAQDTVYDLIVRFARLWCEQVQGMDLLVQQIEQRCRSHPLEVQWKDSCGDTALHRLCQAARLPQQGKQWHDTKYFVEIGHAIMQANPKTATIEKNNWSETPLHQFATHCGMPSSPILSDDDNDTPTASDDVPLMDFFRQLCQNGATKERNYWKAHPLHEACDVKRLKEWKNRSPVLQSLHTNMVKELLIISPETLTATDEYFTTPFNRALFGCAPYVTPALIVPWLQQHQGAQKNPVNRCVPNFAMQVELFLKRYYNDGKTSDATKMQELLDKHMNPVHIAAQFEFQWKNTILLCCAQVYNTITPCPKSQPRLHAMIEMNCPKCCIQLAARLYPKELMMMESHHGETALTLALANQSSSQHYSMWYTVLQEAMALTSAESIPNTTLNLAAITNRHGQLPLHVAISTQHNNENAMNWDDGHGLQWHDGHGLQWHDGHGLQWHDEHGLHELLMAYPRALTLRDPVTRLYPFCITTDITSAFEMLRADPSVVLNAIHTKQCSELHV